MDEDNFISALNQSFGVTTRTPGKISEHPVKVISNDDMEDEEAVTITEVDSLDLFETNNDVEVIGEFAGDSDDDNEDDNDTDKNRQNTRESIEPASAAIRKIAVSAESFLSDHGIDLKTPNKTTKPESDPISAVGEKLVGKLIGGNASSKSLTKPVSPKFATDKRSKLDQLCSPAMMTTEEKLIKKLQEEKERERQQMTKRKKLYERLKANGFQLPIKASSSVSPSKRQTKKVTIPKTPTSRLDKKYGKKIPSVLKKSPVVFTSKDLQIRMQLQSQQPSAVSGPPKLTVPEPFHFETDKRLHSTQSFSGSATLASHSSDSHLRKSMTAGEMANQFFQEARKYVPKRNFQPNKLTDPVSPKLSTATRSAIHQRPLPPSREELEAKEMEEIQKQQFKARPIDRRIFESCGEYGVPKVAVKPPTIPIDIELKTERRAHSTERTRRTTSKEGEETHEFKARPLPSFIKDGPEKLPTPPSKKNFVPTVPVSPKFHPISHRSSIDGEDDVFGNSGELVDDQFHELRRASSAPARRQKPHHSIVEMAKKLEAEMHRKRKPLRLTQPKEFHLQTDQRHEFYQQQLQQQLLKEQEEERQRREVKALPLPNYQELNQTATSAPATIHKPKPLTEPKPFHLRSSDLHEVAQERFQQEKQKELALQQQEEEKAKQFKAKPLPKTTYQPEIEVIHSFEKLHDKENLPENLVRPLNIVLASDQRAEKRKQFDETVQKKREEEELRRRQLLLKQQAEKEEELKSMRRRSVEEGGLMFKAKPILTKDPYPVARRETVMTATKAKP